MFGYLGIVALTNIAVTLQGSGLLIFQIYGQNNLTTIFLDENLLEFEDHGSMMGVHWTIMYHWILAFRGKKKHMWNPIL